ncbi:MAG TPA: cytochrome b/b6 domain-containing protein [Rubrivivax sp.]|jgi:cytochrome b|nr:cytochrome b/b6 domain-containing protein [Rubrivivax sp.]
MNLPPAAATPTRVWDLPTRLFHWLLAVTVTGSVVTATIGGSAMTWHFRLGLLAMALLLFRLAWGLVGGYWSRFVHFLYPPRTIVGYLRDPASAGAFAEVGHSPLGSLSVLAMLGVLCLQVATGLVADDEIANVGPLNRFVSGATAASASSWHKTGGQWSIFALVALHVAAIGFYRVVKQRDLVGPMVGGDKFLPAGVPASADGVRERLLALALAALAGLAAWAVLRLGG